MILWQPSLPVLCMRRRIFQDQLVHLQLLQVGQQRLVSPSQQHRFLFGSDYPFITPQRWLKDFETLDYFKPEVKEKLFWKNGQKLLAHTAVGQMHFST
jgi:predicted TIM-barrel fold metal-dependent hydrolase